VGGAAYIEGAASRRDRVLSLGVLGAPQAKVEEDARAVLLGHGDVSVPVRDRARPGPSVQVHPGEAEGRRNQRARPSSIRPQALAVLVEPRVVAARTPAGEHFLHRGLVDLEKIGEGLRFGASETMRPTLRSRLAQPSRRLPMPGAKEW